MKTLAGSLNATSIRKKKPKPFVYVYLKINQYIENMPRAKVRMPMVFNGCYEIFRDG